MLGGAISFGDKRNIANAKRNVEVDSPASSGGERKYMNYVNFSWPPLEAALSFFTPEHFSLK